MPNCTGQLKIENSERGIGIAVAKINLCPGVINHRMGRIAFYCSQTKKQIQWISRAHIWRKVKILIRNFSDVVCVPRAETAGRACFVVVRLAWYWSTRSLSRLVIFLVVSLSYVGAGLLFLRASNDSFTMKFWFRSTSSRHLNKAACRQLTPLRLSLSFSVDTRPHLTVDWPPQLHYQTMRHCFPPSKSQYQLCQRQTPIYN